MTTTQRKIVSVPVRGGSKESVKITSPDVSAEFARSLYDNDIDVVESFYIVLLDHALQTKHWALIGKGGVSSTVGVVRPRTSDQALGANRQGWSIINGSRCTCNM